MPKKNPGGNKFKKGKNQDTNSRPLVYAEEDQYYAFVDKILGNSMASVKYIEAGKGLVSINAFMRKSLKKKKQYVNPNKYVLISMREFEKDKCDIIHVYTDIETNYLKKKGLIDSSIENESGSSNNIDFEFNDLIDEDDEPKTRQKVSGLGRNNVIIENYGIISSDEEEEEE